MKRRIARVFVLTAIAACAGAGSNGSSTIKVGDPVDINGDGKLDGLAVDCNGDGIADSVDLNGDGKPEALLPGAKPCTTADAGTDAGGVAPDIDSGNVSTGDGDQSTADSGSPTKVPDAGSPDSGTLDIEIPTAKVPCGSDICEVANGNLCCQSWSASTGFGTDSFCISEDDCLLDDITGITDQGKYYEVGDTNRAVVSRCDGAEDCGANQICCYVHQGQPLPRDGITYSPPWLGPGAGRQCMFLADCKADAAANGVPTGVLSCNDDGDCSQDKGTSCQSEQDYSETTGLKTKARADAKVCR